MRKELLKKIEKTCKKGNITGVTLNPTLEECDYLYSRNITSTKSTTSRSSIVFDFSYLIDTTDFCLE